MADPTTYPAPGDKTAGAQAQREAHWRAVIDRWAKSGLAKTTFCRQESISVSALSWWVRALRARDEARRRTPAKKPRRQQRARSAFVPVRVIEAAPKADTTPVEVVTRGGRVIRVRPGFDAATLRRVIAALEDASCGCCRPG